jgi:hypothetical protein
MSSVSDTIWYHLTHYPKIEGDLIDKVREEYTPDSIKPSRQEIIKELDYLKSRGVALPCMAIDKGIPYPGVRLSPKEAVWNSFRN